MSTLSPTSAFRPPDHWDPAPKPVARVAYDNPTPVPALPPVESDLESIEIGPHKRLESHLFNGIVGPRVIGWISTQSRAGVLNLAPYSFFNGFNYTPPIVGFSSTAYKDSLQNAEATGEFVWNLVTRPLAEAMNATCAHVSADTDEFALAGLTPVASRIVRPPRVGESPVAFECKVTDIVRLKSHTGQPADAWVTFGEVVAVHIARRLLIDGRYQTDAARPVLRAGGPGDFYELGARFLMSRPK
ncbi:MAG: hypothetical protein RLZZ126_2140 [Pseudomonadota bacterium]|jgi:flavin reductase (DIM6/NTAB) family NADH-FMN oxidoreductase RutF